MPKVFIIVPVYNAEKTLRKTIESIRKQTFTDYELILVDDGSKDESGAICDAAAKKDRRIKVIHQGNQGVIAARLAGIRGILQEGYTTFCDADDYLPKDAVEKLITLAEAENADLVSGTLYRVFGKLMKMRGSVPPSMTTLHTYCDDEIRLKLLPSYFGITDFPGYMPTKLYRNELLCKSVDFECPVKFFQEDIAFNLQLLLLAKRVVTTPEPVYCYRSGGGTSRFMPTFLEDCISLYQFKKEQIEKNDLSQELHYYVAVELKNEVYTWLEMHYAKNRNREETLKEIAVCCKRPEIIEAVNYPRDDTSGVREFRELVREGRVNEIYALIESEFAKKKWKRTIKSLLNRF